MRVGYQVVKGKFGQSGWWGHWGGGRVGRLACRRGHQAPTSDDGTRRLRALMRPGEERDVLEIGRDGVGSCAKGAIGSRT